MENINVIKSAEKPEPEAVKKSLPNSDDKKEPDTTENEYVLRSKAREKLLQEEKERLKDQLVDMDDDEYDDMYDLR